MTATARDRRDRLRAMLADLKMPGALEAVDGVLAKVDSGAVTAGEAIEQVLGAQIALRNNRRLQAAMRSSRLPAVKTLAQFDFTFQRDVGQKQAGNVAVGQLHATRGVHVERVRGRCVGRTEAGCLGWCAAGCTARAAAP